MFNFLKTCLPVGRNKKEPENLEEVLGFLKKLEGSQEDISRELKELKEKNKKNLQKIGMVRFNPFPEVGGDQSFSIAVLNADNNGFVITSHYLRDSNRVYAKPIKNGQSQYQLSSEEKKAIEEAIASENSKSEIRNPKSETNPNN